MEKFSARTKWYLTRSWKEIRIEKASGSHSTTDFGKKYAKTPSGKQNERHKEGLYRCNVGPLWTDDCPLHHRAAEEDHDCGLDEVQQPRLSLHPRWKDVV